MSARTTTAATLTLAALLLTGCGEANEPSVLGTASPAAALEATPADATPSSTASPKESSTSGFPGTAAPGSPTSTVSEGSPVIGRSGGTLSATDFNAAKDVLSAYVAAINTAQVDGDVTGLNDYYTSTCTVCVALQDSISTYAPGDRLEDNGLTVVNVDLVNVFDEMIMLDVAIDQAPGRFIPADGSEVTTYTGAQGKRSLVVIRRTGAEAGKISQFDPLS